MKTTRKIAAVSYLNTIPMIYGIERSGLFDAELMLSPPAGNVTCFLDGSADIALIPVGALGQVPGARVITPYCIGAAGKVRTVVITGNQPIEQTRRLWLDSHSRTSVLLGKVLCGELWGCRPECVPLEDYAVLDSPREGDAFLLIGDKVFPNEGRFRYTYDLAEGWEELTGLPFVFAVWVAGESVTDEEAVMLGKALEYGVGNITAAIDYYGHGDKEYAWDYLSRNIDYHLDDGKRKALDLYLDKISRLQGR